MIFNIFFHLPRGLWELPSFLSDSVKGTFKVRGGKVLYGTQVISSRRTPGILQGIFNTVCEIWWRPQRTGVTAVFLLYNQAFWLINKQAIYIFYLVIFFSFASNVSGPWKMSEIRKQKGKCLFKMRLNKFDHYFSSRKGTDMKLGAIVHLWPQVIVDC